MPTSVSQHLKLNPQKFKMTGALDTILDIDTRLFIDPLLLRNTAAPELANSAARVEQRFSNILRLLKRSSKPADALERRAEKLMEFPEVKGICIGYSSNGTAGSGMGPALRKHLLSDAKQIIQAGVEDPEIFDLAGLFEKDIGPDRISDMVAGIIQIDLIKYTTRILSDLRIPIKNSKLPINPYNKQPIILVPRDILRDLPLALDWEDISLVASHNQDLRNTLNEIIGSTWKQASRKASKSDIREVILRHPDVLSDLIQQYTHKNRTGYDFEEDRAGQVIWHQASIQASTSYPLALRLPPKPTIDEIYDVVKKICDHFRTLIENHGLWKLLYNVDGSPKHEEAAQLIFYGLAHAYCEANNLAISPESDGGRGPVDFKFSSGYQLSVLVEAKLSKSSALKSGYTKQLPTYLLSEKSKRGIYLVIDNGATVKKMKSFNDLVRASRKSNLNVIHVDGTPKVSASKLR